MTTFDVETVPVAFNMDLANAPTGERFCYAAADVLCGDVTTEDAAILADACGEFRDEVIQEWTDALDANGYYVIWSCGDVVVYDLRELSDDEREAFYDATEGW